MPVRPIPPSEAEYLLEVLHDRYHEVRSRGCQGTRHDRNEDGGCECSRCSELTKIEYAEEAVEAASAVVATGTVAA